MAILRLGSSNDRLSYVINKNPLNPAIVKPLRKGFISAWFNEAGEYCAYFSDHPSEMSFSNKEYDYLDKSAMESALAYLGMINELFSTTVKKVSEDDVPADHVISIGAIHSSAYLIDQLTRHFSSGKYIITAELVYGSTYSIVIACTEVSVNQALSLTSLIALLCLERSELPIGTDVIVKYIKLMKGVGVPYYIARIFATRYLEKKQVFAQVKKDVVSACLGSGLYDSVSILHGSNLEQRKDYVSDLIRANPNHHLVDVGCGEGNYLYLSKLISDDCLYYPIDVDASARDRVSKRVEYKGFTNVTDPLTSFSEWLELGVEEPCIVLLTEVLEHMELRESKQLLLTILKTPAVRQVIITLPNQDFNQFYGIAVRHEDHKWEATESIIKDLAPTGSYSSMLITSVGDVINSIPCTYGVHVTK